MLRSRLLRVIIERVVEFIVIEDFTVKFWQLCGISFFIYRMLFYIKSEIVGCFRYVSSGISAFSKEILICPSSTKLLLFCYFEFCPSRFVFSFLYQSIMEKNGQIKSSSIVFSIHLFVNFAQGTWNK